jgi:cyclopropane-fatty-acyl-phospholipid synthase
MTLLARAVHLFETTPLPDLMRRKAVALLVASTSRRLRNTSDVTARFAEDMRTRPIAEHTEAANAQHYEVPGAFFLQALGPRLKYSCCRYNGPDDTLAEAERRALRETAENAGLADGQQILELGCGWGSLTLWMAERYRNAQITAVSNSHSQRAYIEAQAQLRGFQNLSVITADANVFEIDQSFDRIVSIEMFEHMSNWRALFEKCRRWLKPDGQMLIHVFVHKTTPYRFDPANTDDWIAQHFFAGGVMPSRDLIGSFGDIFSVANEWWWNGKNYERTALDWLANFDARIGAIRPVLEQAYGRQARVWETRWRLFFLATAGLFGHDEGEEWGVMQYRLRAAP